MRSISREEIQEDFDALRAVVSRIAGHSYDALTTPERLALLERLEQETRRLPVPGHALINQLVQHASPAELGGKLCLVLADRLRITRSEANRRVAEAADLGPRRSITGEPLAPRLAATAAAQRHGEAGTGHVAVIRRFLDELPCCVEPKPANAPRRIWPRRPPSIAPKWCTSWPTGWRAPSTPTATSPTKIALAAAA